MSQSQQRKGREDRRKKRPSGKVGQAKVNRIFGEESFPLPADGKFPTLSSVVMAVEFELSNTTSDYNIQEKNALKFVTIQLKTIWSDLAP